MTQVSQMCTTLLLRLTQVKEVMSRHYHFKFTINNYTEEHQTNLRALNYKYLVYGFEIAPDTGTPYLQGHISFHTQRTVGSVIKKIPGHISVADLLVASIAYCKKCGNFWEDGTPPCKNGGKQTELITKERIQECATWDAVLSIPNIANKMAFARECWRLKPRSMDTVDTLRPWQEEELALLLNQDDRQIRFIVDLKGGMGKSVLGRYLHEKHGAFYTRWETL